MLSALQQDTIKMERKMRAEASVHVVHVLCMCCACAACMLCVYKCDAASCEQSSALLAFSALEQLFSRPLCNIFSRHRRLSLCACSVTSL